MSTLANQVAVVTGAGRGIGRAIALKFAAEGADVVCVSRTVENSEKVAAEVRALGRRAWAHAVDVSDSAAISSAAEKILAEDLSVREAEEWVRKDRETPREVTAAEPATAQYARGLADSMGHHLDELERLLEAPASDLQH